MKLFYLLQKTSEKTFLIVSQVMFSYSTEKKNILNTIFKSKMSCGINRSKFASGIKNNNFGFYPYTDVLALYT